MLRDEHEALQAELVAITKEVMDLQMAAGAQIDGGAITMIRLSALVDTLYGPSPADLQPGELASEERLRLEIATQARFRQIIVDNRAAIARAKLMQGVRVDPRSNGGQN